jgi:CheY-like chemotaxis protein
MPPRVVFIEDNVGDYELMVEAFIEIGFDARYERFADGCTALERLTEGADERPALILVDINLPRLDGVEVLARLRRLANCRDVPIVVLTSSTAEVDRRRCVQADAYFPKRSLWSECLVLARELKRIAELGRAA